VTIRGSWEALKAEREQLRRADDAFVAKVDRFVAWVTSVSRAAASMPADEVAPAPVVRPDAPIPPFAPPAAEGPTGEPTRGVKATMWRNRADEGVDPAAMSGGRVAQPGDGHRYAWVALPAQIRAGVQRRVWARLSSTPTNPPVGPVPQMDTGPWWDGTRGAPGTYSPDLEDHWWDGSPGRRPRVEGAERDARGRVDNDAGIDITPRFGAQVVKAAGQHPELTEDQLAMRYYEAPCELMLDVWVEEGETVHDGPSPHFTWREVSRSDRGEAAGIDNSVPDALRPGVVEFAAGIVEPIRHVLGRKMKYGRDWTSWFRSAALNLLAGGSATSGHLTGQGMDVPRTEEFWRAIRAAKIGIPLHLNVEPDHYDVKVGVGPVEVSVSWIKGAVATPWEN
jgi:hypothetical protein